MKKLYVPLFFFALVNGSEALSSVLSSSQVLQQKSKLLGQELSVTQEYGTSVSGTGVASTSLVKFIGNPKSLLDANVQYNAPASSTSSGSAATPSATPQDPLAALIGNTSHSFYVDGIRIWGDQEGYSNGSLTFSGGVPPTSISIPALMYPIGPLVLELDAGISFEAQIAAKLTPGISFPLQDSTLNASLSANAGASGFVEGSARILIIRAGLGGSLNIVTGDVSVDALIYFKNQVPTLTYGGQVSVLSGRIYAFVDTDLFFGVWQPLWSKDLYAWKGKCWAFGAESCAN